MFTAKQQQYVEQALTGKNGRIHHLHIDGVPVIIKRTEPVYKNWGYAILRILATLLHQPMLRATPAPDGKAAQETEVLRLQNLRSAGAPVPEVLHVTPQWIALSFLGTTTLDHMLREPNAPALHYWKSGLDAIVALHHLNQAASQCFARNMIWQDGKISFIDFEDDPLQNMPLPCAQARDWLLYLHASAYILPMPPQKIAHIFLHHVSKDKSAVLHEVLRVAHTLNWLRILPANRKVWGRDVVAVRYAAAALHHISMATRQQKQLC